MFNSDMVLYFLSTFLRLGTPPKEMIDRNIRTDYNKTILLHSHNRELRSATSPSSARLWKTDGTTANINRSFPADRMVDTNNFQVAALLLRIADHQRHGAGKRCTHHPQPDGTRTTLHLSRRHLPPGRTLRSRSQQTKQPDGRYGLRRRLATRLHLHR